ncbi:MAG: prolyl oligopeptidase family serine peptidase, partial [Gemmatimonadetes bacterium]|nr:prolyl oligopeptidase family serine peptidase [Gemmatimonadota bacterium]
IYMRPAPDQEAEPRPIDPTGEYELLIDPHTMSDDYSVSVAIQAVSPDGKRLLYHVRDGGADEREIRLLDVEAGVDLPDRLPWALYGTTAFTPDGDAFYYVLRDRTIGPRVYRHTIGTPMSEDVELFGEGHGPEKFINVRQLEDGRYLLYTVPHGWSKHDIYVQDIAANGPITPVVEDVYAHFNPQYIDGQLYLHTDMGASNYRVMAADLDNPGPENWREVIPEGEDVMQGFSLIDDKFYVRYLHNVSSQIKIFEKDGTPAGEMEIPEFHTATIRGGRDGTAFLTLNGFTTPRTVYKVDLETGEREVWDRQELDFDPTGIAVEQLWYTSKDGTRAPMFVVHRDDVELDGDNPTLLTGYGGFNVSRTPRFSTRTAMWVERGGVWALATLRGGSEFGEEWHRAGQLENKQNVFDDFIAAAEHLIAAGYTNPKKLAIQGGSNGGLLVASALTQRPELYAAVLCTFPDVDMARFFLHTTRNNAPALLEYGNGVIPEQFEFLRAYSPVQNVRDHVKYPAVMLATGDLDTRVPPLAARKFTAELQAATSSRKPVIIRYNPREGHAGGRGLSQSIENGAMEMAFLLQQLGAN